jgi:predicted MarR family transcription regulator
VAVDDDAEPQKKDHGQAPQIGPVVILANASMPSLSKVAFAVAMANLSFERWTMRCMTAARLPGLPAPEVKIVPLVKTVQYGKGTAVSIAKAGVQLCARYGEIRQALLVRTARQLGRDRSELSHRSSGA